MSSPPVKYLRYFDFTTFASLNPDKPLPGASVDVELNRLKTTTDQTIDRLALIQRQDGSLANNSVGLDQLAPEVSLGFGAPTNWAPGVLYKVTATVWANGDFMQNLVEHVSLATWALDAPSWMLIVDFGNEAAAAAASATAAANSAAAALASQNAANAAKLAAEAAATASQNSAANSQASATAAAGSAAASAASAATATAQANIATTKATEAAASALAAQNSAAAAAASAAAVAGPNKIINGDFRIDQRNGGAAVVCNINNWTFAADRWAGYATPAAGVYSLQQVVDNGRSWLKATVTTPDAALAATDLYVFRHTIEGLNLADLLWGTANAKPATLSFRLKTSLAGNYSGSIVNGANDRNLPFLFNYAAAGVEQVITVPIVGDVAGVWLANNGIGARLHLSLGAGANYRAAPGVWAAPNVYAATGEIALISTNGATLQITDVKFEAGAVATPFVSDDVQVALAKCQRYYQKYTLASLFGIAAVESNATAYMPVRFSGDMRAAPTATVPPGGSSGNGAYFTAPGGGQPSVIGSHSATQINNQYFRLNGTGYTGLGTPGFATELNGAAGATITADAEL